MGSPFCRARVWEGAGLRRKEFELCQPLGVVSQGRQAEGITDRENGPIRVKRRERCAQGPPVGNLGARKVGWGSLAGCGGWENVLLSECEI